MLIGNSYSDAFPMAVVGWCLGAAGSSLIIWSYRSPEDPSDGTPAERGSDP